MRIISVNFQKLGGGVGVFSRGYFSWGGVWIAIWVTGGRLGGRYAPAVSACREPQTRVYLISKSELRTTESNFWH